MLTAPSLLSSYRRRLEREKAGDNKLSEEEVSRKRVTGLMYTMTNSIEIAGPLAALYILRKSPCYRSHDFQSLPLDSIIKGFISCKENNLEDDFEQNVDLIKDISFSKDESKTNDEKVLPSMKVIVIVIVIVEMIMKVTMILIKIRMKKQQRLLTLF